MSLYSGGDNNDFDESSYGEEDSPHETMKIPNGNETQPIGGQNVYYGKPVQPTPPSSLLILAGCLLALGCVVTLLWFAWLMLI